MISNKIPNTSQCRDLFIVIRKNKKLPLNLLKLWCDEMFDEYAFIEHENDIEPITGLIEGCHYHIYCHVRERGVAKSTHLNKICQIFSFKDSDGICIEKIGNKINALQYLIHKNDKEKTQHKVSDIVTNMDSEKFNRMMTAETGETVSFDTIYLLCITNKTISGVIKSLGIGLYRSYRNVVWDIWNDVKSEKNKKIDLEKEVTCDKSIELN